jgi:hypothetical protein
MTTFINNSFKFITSHLNDIILVSLGIFIFIIFKNNFNNADNNADNNGDNNDENNDDIVNKEVKKEIIIEGFDENTRVSKFDTIVKNNTSNFCEKLKGNSHLIEEECNKQSDSRCKLRSCCVLIHSNNENKCVSGNRLGPTYHTDDNGNDLNIDFYYYHNKCYGNLCPK